MSYAGNLEDELGGLDINELPPELQEEARQDKEKRSQGGYRYDSAADRAHIKAQRGAIWAWLRGLGGNLIKHGVNLTKVPLPVELCEPRSFLERLTDSWAYMDLLHAAAAAATDPVERLKLVVAFVVGGMRQQVSCDKPFNPILGETLQGHYSCGCEVCAEQISHHPPISCWQVRDHEGRFEFTGSSCWSATFSGNSVKGSQSGQSRVTFASDGATVTWSLPSIHIRGVLFGERVVKYHDTLVFADTKNNLECVLHIEPHAPKKGLVKRVLNKARHPRGKQHSHDLLQGELLRRPAAAAGSKGGPVVLDTCSGTWLTDLTWDKGVRSTILPDSFDPAAAAAAAAKTAAAAAAAAATADEDAGSVVCHSIGSFSTTSGSTISDADADAIAATAAAAAAGEGGVAAMNGSSAAANHHSHHSSSSSNGGSGLTASSLAAHTSSSAAAAAQPVPPPLQQQQQQPAAAVRGGGLGAVLHNSSSAALSASDAAGHRSGRGISVVKQLWAPNISTVYRLDRLRDDDPTLLPSDARYRPDVMALAAGANNAAQRWKMVLEQRQRADRNMRGHAAAAAASAGGSSSSGGGAAAGHHHRHSSRGSEHTDSGLEDQIIKG